MTDGERYYTYKGAAHRVGRSVGQIKQWKRDGMETEVDDEGRVIVAHSVLMAEFRARLQRNPVQPRPDPVDGEVSLGRPGSLERALTSVLQLDATGLDSASTDPPTV